MPITVVELGEHVSANPDTKKQAVEEQFQLWGGAYDRNYIIQNVVFCPSCSKVSHFDDWTNSISNGEENNKES